MSYKHCAGSCECPSCTIAIDDFTGADTGGTITDWTKVLGTWERAGNQLRGSAARALIVHDTLHPDGDAGGSRVRVLIEPDFTAGAATARLIAAYADSDNYLFGEVRLTEGGCGELQIGERVAGVETWLSGTAAIPAADSASLWLYLCWRPPSGSGSAAVAGELTALAGSSNTVCVSSEADGSGDQVGLEVTDGEVCFDDWLWEYYYDAALHPNCPRCSCETVCLIFGDNFDGRDELGCYTSTGSWFVDQPAGALFGSGAGAITTTAAAGTDEDPVRVSATVKNTSGTGSLRLQIGKTDDDNYLFAELQRSTATTARLGQCVAGAVTYLSDETPLPGVNLDDGLALLLCWTPGAHLDATEAMQQRYAEVEARSDAGPGDDDYADIENVLGEEDGLVATFVFTADDQETPRLTAGAFGFALPPGSTPVGIVVGIGAEYPATQSEVVDIELYYLWAGDQASSNMATFTVVPDQGSGDNIEGGGVATLSGGDPEWHEINQELFSVSFKLRTNTEPTSNAPLEVDFIAAEVHFLTPARGPGRLTLKIGETCLAAYGVIHDSGSLAGIRLGHGTWQIDDFQFSYAASADRPTCPSCCTQVFCTVDEQTTAAASYAINLGAGTLGSAFCDCAGITGTIIVEAGYLPVGIGYFNPALGNALCTWTLLVDIDCSSAAQLVYYLHLVAVAAVDLVPQFRWYVIISIVADTLLGLGGAYARYMTADSFPAEDVLSTTPKTLFKVHDSFGAASCTGSLPEFITVEPVT